LLFDAEDIVITTRREPEQDRDLGNFLETPTTPLEIVLPGVGNRALMAINRPPKC
jgi:hypothetical protein